MKNPSVHFCAVASLVAASLMTAERVSAQANTLLVSTQTLTFSAPAGSTVPLIQTVAATSTNAPLPVAVTVRYLSAAGSWLSVSPSSGTTALIVTATADPNGLPVGSYVAQIVFASGFTQSAVVTVTLTVGGVSSGNLTATPASVTLSAASGIASQVVTIGGPSAVTVNASATTNFGGNWLTVSPTTAITPASLTISANSLGLTPGTQYSGTVTVSSPNGPGAVSIPVTFVAGGTGTGLSLSQSSLVFGYQIGTPAPAGQSVLVSSSIGVSTFSAVSTTSWLKMTTNINGTPATAVSGATNSSLTVIVDPSGLTSGTYNASITVSAGTATATLPVTLNVSTNSVLNAAPSSLSFAYQPGAISPPAQQVLISTTGSPVAFSASASSSGWLLVGPQTGATNGANVLTVSVSPFALTVGTYNGSINVIGGSTSLTIPVSITVGSTGGSIIASPQSMFFEAQIGGSTLTQTLSFSSITPQNFSISATANGGNWLQVSPASGSTPSAVSVTVNPSVITAPGVYTGNILVSNLTDSTQLAVPVTINVSGGVISVNPTAMIFTQSAGGPSELTQLLQLNANGTPPYSISSNVAWLTVSPATGNAPASVTVTANAAGLSAGTYQGTLTVSSGGTNIAVNVTFNVSAAAVPTLTPSNLTFNFTGGSGLPASQTISVGSSGSALSIFASAQTTTGGNWLSVSSNSPSTPATLTVSVSPVGLAPGTYLGTVTVAPSSGESRTAQVTLNVAATTLPVVRAVLSGATLRPTLLSPGLIVTIQGTNLGPQVGVPGTVTAAGAVLTVAAQTRVLFDGVPAAILYARQDQINAVVPYAVSGRFATQIQAEVAGVRSDPFELRLVEAAPGIFTMDSSGLGQAAALNQNNTVNGPQNPASAGTVVSLYGTGEGNTTPGGQDGRIINTDLRRPTLPVSATIGGVPVEVLYAGSASGLVSGALQVNLLINGNVPTGPAIPVEIRVGNNISPTGVTIAIR